MHFKLTLILLFFCSYIGFSQSGMSCSDPIPVDISQPNLSLPVNKTGTTWYKISPDSSKRNFVFTGVNMPEYKIYELNDSTCVNKHQKVVSSGKVDKESAYQLNDQLSLEELEGICTCRFCEEGGRKIRLELGKSYLLKVHGVNAMVNVNTEGKKESQVWTRKEWYQEEMVPGKRLVLENILFYGGLTNLLPGSQTDLEHLVKLMKMYPNMKIEIHGHVNAPGQLNTRKNQALSDGRAETVYNHLITNGVFADRMTFKGYGNTQMMYPKPSNEWQQKKNRRVEILIVSVE